MILSAIGTVGASVFCSLLICLLAYVSKHF